MKRVLYIIDDINYNSGAKKVTLFQMRMLQKNCEVYLLTLAKPMVKNELDFLDEQHILTPKIWGLTEIYALSFKKAITSKRYRVSEKLSRILYTLSLRMGMGNRYFEHVIGGTLKSLLESFDAVIVVSEASKLRNLVSNLKHPKKIQWIHTDYARWSAYSEWSKAVTRDDAQLYQKFDHLVVLSENCKTGMVQKLPNLKHKISVIPNMIDGERILRLANEESSIKLDEKYLNLVTVARIDREKGIDRLLKLAKALKQDGVLFRWYVIGDGPQKELMEKKNKENKTEAEVIFLGHMENPYPIMSRCNALVLLSKYEGTPVTIDEAMVLGIGVAAPDVGGIKEQIGGYYKGVVYKDNIGKASLVSFLEKKKEDMARFAYVDKNKSLEKRILGFLGENEK